MGKRKSKQSISTSVCPIKVKQKLSKTGIHKRTKKNKNKQNKNIKKLFDNLRTEASSSNSSINTVIEIVDNTQETNESTENLPIVIEDDTIVNSPSKVETPRASFNLCPIQCSTPKYKISNNNNNDCDFSNDVVNLTREINNDSYVTIDLTADSTGHTTKHNTVIDLINNSSLDSNISMSGDLDVTVINTKKHSNRNQLRKFVTGIANMDSSEKGKLLEMIAQKIFSGCDGPHSLHSLRNGISRATETIEDAFIREVILGQAPSRNSIGSNIYNPERDIRNKTGLRMVVIDGSNVAMQHTKGRIFSVKGLKICIDYFVNRGHVVKAFVPHFRCKLGKSTDGRLLDQLERQGLVVYTPSREIQGRFITSYDDRYIVQCAAEFDGVIVSGDNYRDLMAENPRWRYIIENRLLQFTWVGDMIMFPRDPLGRDGPTLEQFLRHPFPNERK
ncbi:unnamed protein product [Leptosia nina]|uniref:RNase NYN domain-containing protein n=1 Tax=Leptosia nina TaxID=320188 RepID=A0AAV1JEG5_9NEOP